MGQTCFRIGIGLAVASASCSFVYARGPSSEPVAGARADTAGGACTDSYRLPEADVAIGASLVGLPLLAMFFVALVDADDAPEFATDKLSYDYTGLWIAVGAGAVASTPFWFSAYSGYARVNKCRRALGVMTRDDWDEELARRGAACATTPPVGGPGLVTIAAPGVDSPLMCDDEVGRGTVVVRGTRENHIGSRPESWRDGDPIYHAQSDVFAELHRRAHAAGIDVRDLSRYTDPPGYVPCGKPDLVGAVPVAIGDWRQVDSVLRIAVEIADTRGLSPRDAIAVTVQPSCDMEAIKAGMPMPRP